MSDPSAEGRVLVVDDEANITDLVATALRYEGFDVEVAARPAARRSPRSPSVPARPGRARRDAARPRRLRGRAAGCAPTAAACRSLFLTARDATEDKVAGLTVGGDDYVTKPFSLEELVARVRAVLRRDRRRRRRTSAASRSPTSSSTTTPTRCGAAGSAIELTPTEYKLLRYLLLNAGRVLSKAQILDHVWQYDFGGDANVVETYISYLRKKIDTLEPAADPHRPRRRLHAADPR